MGIRSGSTRCWPNVEGAPSDYSRRSAAESAAWFEARLGKPTASKAADVIARLKNGNPAQSRTSYAYRLVAERLSGPQPQFITAAMQRGLDEEDEASQGCTSRAPDGATETVGFGIADSGLWGASPDALVDDGLLDVKTTAAHLFVADCLQDANGVPERFRAQMTMQCLVFERPWCDVAQYCSPLEGAARGAVGAGRGRAREDARRVD